MDNKFFQEATNAYIAAYNTAMEQMHNPNAATQTAMSVTMAYIATVRAEMRQKEQEQAIGLGILRTLATATEKAMAKRNGQNDSEDSKKK